MLYIGKVLTDGKEIIDIIEFNPVNSFGLEWNNLLFNELLNQKLPQKTLVRKKSIKKILTKC